jgi:hypothetical protein
MTHTKEKIVVGRRRRLCYVCVCLLVEDKYLFVVRQKNKRKDSNSKGMSLGSVLSHK